MGQAATKIFNQTLLVKNCKQLTKEISSSGWINLLVALVVVRVAGLLVIDAAGLAAVLFVVLVVEAVDCV